MTHELKIDLGERSYTIVVGAGDFDAWQTPLRPVLAGRRVAVVSDDRVSALYRSDFESTLEAVGATLLCWHDLPQGEASKSLEALGRVHDDLLSAQFGRDGIVCALGGGVVGDLAGFAAASIHRGVPWVQVPTTLLAMVDSGIGGKTGINHRLGKNLIGAFHQPLVVTSNLRVLNTLDRAELSNGFAEIIKYGVISDSTLFSRLEASAEALLALEHAQLLDIILTSARIKSEVVERDERESGLRMILNFGHTLGHAIERTAGFGVWSHGQAVAVGMVMAAEFGAWLGRTPAHLASQVADCCRQYELPISIDRDHRAALADAVSHDKKVRGDDVKFVFPVELGRAEVHSVPLWRLKNWLRD